MSANSLALCAVLLIPAVAGILAYVLIRPNRVAQAGQTPGAGIPTLPAPPVFAAFLGDSYTAGSGASDPSVRWSTLVAEKEGWTELNFGFGGTGYSTAGVLDGGQPYLARVPAVVAAKPEIVIVAGGRNDLDTRLTDAQIEEDVFAVFRALRAGLPNAVIIAVSPVWDSTTPPARLATIAADVRSAVIDVRGTYLDIGEPLAGNTAAIGPDAVHPNDTGYAILAAAIEKKIGPAGSAVVDTHVTSDRSLPSLVSGTEARAD